LVAVGGRVNLVSVAGSGEVAFDPASSDPATATPDTSAAGALGVVALTDGAALLAPTGGRVTVRAASLALGHATINTDTDVATGGGVDLLATGAATIADSGVSAATFGAADGGQIRITADTLTIRGLA